MDSCGAGKERAVMGEGRAKGSWGREESVVGGGEKGHLRSR